LVKEGPKRGREGGDPDTSAGEGIGPGGSSIAILGKGEKYRLGGRRQQGVLGTLVRVTGEG